MFVCAACARLCISYCAPCVRGVCLFFIAVQHQHIRFLNRDNGGFHEFDSRIERIPRGSAEPVSQRPAPARGVGCGVGQTETKMLRFAKT